ncbi:hypothetical protein BDAP_002654 [Binucleata daphniae]
MLCYLIIIKATIYRNIVYKEKIYMDPYHVKVVQPSLILMKNIDDFYEFALIIAEKNNKLAKLYNDIVDAFIERFYFEPYFDRRHLSLRVRIPLNYNDDFIKDFFNEKNEK